MSGKNRVFADSVVGSEDFLFMQGLSQALYFRLCMTADDKGVVNNARTLVRSIGASEEHLQELIDLDFVIQIQDKPRLYVIKDWFVMNNPEKYKGKESDFVNEINAAVFIDITKRYRRLEDKEKYKPYQNQRSKDKNTEKLADEERVFEKNSPEEKRKEEKRREKKRKETHTSEMKLNESAESVCVGVCADDCVCADDTSDMFTCADVDPPGDPPSDMPHELTQKAEQLRQKLSESGLRVPDKISWLMREFRFALDGKRRLKLTDEEFFGGLENYAKLLALRKKSPDAFWWSATPQIPSLFTGSSPQILRFLPAVFDVASFKKTGKARASPRRGIDSEYSLKAIAEGA